MSSASVRPLRTGFIICNYMVLLGMTHSALTDT